VASGNLRREGAPGRGASPGLNFQVELSRDVGRRTEDASLPVLIPHRKNARGNARVEAERKSRGKIEEGKGREFGGTDKRDTEKLRASLDTALTIITTTYLTQLRFRKHEYHESNDNRKADAGRRSGDRRIPAHDERRHHQGALIERMRASRSTTK